MVNREQLSKQPLSWIGLGIAAILCTVAALLVGTVGTVGIARAAA